MSSQSDLIVGIDEAGTGCLAGPAFLAAVGFACAAPANIRDSKKIKGRAAFRAARISIESITTLITGVTIAPEEIDELGMGRAWDKGVETLLHEVKEWDPKQVIIDGCRRPPIRFPLAVWHDRIVSYMIKADDKIPQVSAASIIAKDDQLREMRNLDSKFPHYGFGNHHGYATAKHCLTIKQRGPCAAHRRSYRRVKEYT